MTWWLPGIIIKEATLIELISDYSALIHDHVHRRDASLYFTLIMIKDARRIIV